MIASVERSFRLVFVTILSAVALSSCGPEPDPIIIDDGNDSAGDDRLVRVSEEMPPLILPTDNPLSKEGVELGRILFYDPFLSGDGTQSCGSCHNPDFGFTDNGNRFSEGIRGDLGDRNSMPLFNLMWSNSLFWDSRAETLRHLALMPIENPIEMDQEIGPLIERLNEHNDYKQQFKTVFGIDQIDSTHLAMALEQFLLTIISDNSKFDRVNRGQAKLTEQEQRGFDKLKVKGCFNCHSTTLFHDNKSHNTGLDAGIKDKGLGGHNGQSTDLGKFRTPSLRNIMLTAPYMHDGRFSTIEEVLDFYDTDVHINAPNVTGETQRFLSIGMRNRLTPIEQEEIIAFLHALTDQQMVDDPRFSDPSKP